MKFMETLNYFTYEKENIKCNKCGWSGLGKQLENGEIFDSLYELNCPKCHKPVGFISFPSFEEVLEFGTPEEKAKVLKSIEWNKKVDSSLLRSEDSLGEINGPVDLVFMEVSSEGEVFLEMYANDKLIWKEIIYYEYYDRFIKILEVFKNRYGGRIRTIEYNKSYHLLGDSYAASSKVELAVNSILSSFK